MTDSDNMRDDDLVDELVAEELHDEQLVAAEELDDEVLGAEEDTEGDEASFDDEDSEFANIRPVGRPDSLREKPNCKLPLRAQIEAVLFASPKCVKPIDVLEVLGDDGLTVNDIERELEALVAEFEQRGGGFSLEHIRGHGYQFRTVADAGPLMERLFASKPRPLSRAALETLSIIAYRQPVTRADVEFVRGVDAGSIIKNLLERGLIRCVGRKEDAGRPMLFGTTDEFLAVFRMSSLNDLPPLSAFQPSHDSMKKAFDQIEGGEDEIDQEGDFVGEETDNPIVSGGLHEMEVAELALLPEGDASSSLLDESMLEAPAPTANERSGAVRAAEDFDDDNDSGQDQNPEVDFSVGDSVSAGSRALDPSGEDLS